MDPVSSSAADITHIVQTTNNVCICVDHQRWAEARSHFTATVEIDYRALGAPTVTHETSEQVWPLRAFHI